LKGEKQQFEGALAKNAISESNLREASEEQGKRIEELNDQVEELNSQLLQLKDELGEKNALLDESEKEARELQDQMKRIRTQNNGFVEQRGRVWERPFEVGSIPFQPLSIREMPIISVLNLKGGVGKTTITANLGAMLAMRGFRVLLIDLDYQRSLTLLCCPPSKVKELHDSARSLQHFLLNPQADANRLLACAAPIETARGCEIVINSDPLDSKEKGDNLEEVEMHLLAEWLTNPASPDIRLTLRKALHSPWIRERFHYVLLDCPPRLSTACINALAASDFAIIPVMLDYPSANSAYNLLRKLRRLRERNVLAELSVLGVLANRVKLRLDELVNDEADVWDKVQAPCQLAWEAPVYFFKTFIKQHRAFADAAARSISGESKRTVAAQHHDLKPIFDNLVQEMMERIEHERQHLAAVS
jgi:cellulose biosynthesis protein BcsQ